MELTKKIKTARLNLVPIAKQYVNQVYSNYEQSIHTYLSPSLPQSIKDTAHVVDKMIQQWTTQTDFVFVIVNSTNLEFLGLCGLHDLKTGAPHIGIWLKKSAHNKKYGQEAVGALINCAKEIGLKEIYYDVDYRNIPSMRIANLYNGILIETEKAVNTADGRTLFLNNYVIPLK